MRETKRLDGAEILVVSPTPTWPLDHGNRKRIHSVCNALKDRGAVIHFLYYPSEGDWRGTYPKNALQAMQRQWDYVYKVTPSIALHTSAKGDSHLIDEWWDEAVENEVKWLMARNDFDAIIVNYSWLSKALTFAPPGCLRVLDTHDRFSGRGALLEAHGIEKEFFHTSPKEEFKALERADIVWAIKHEEEVFFRDLLERFEHEEEPKPLKFPPIPPKEEEEEDWYDYAATEVCTLLHVEEKEGFEFSAPYRSNGYLTVGIVGAYNNINLVNTRAFLEKALPIFEKYMAPVKILLAGSMCRGLSDINHPFVELLGRVESLEDFYSRLDIALVPMTFSTGLKIKVGEALAYGVPIIAHAHAFEGYPDQHEWHTLESMEAIAEAVTEAAFAPEKIDELQTATRRAQQALHQEVETTLDRFVEAVKEKRPSVSIVLQKLAAGEHTLQKLMIGELVKNLGETHRLLFYYPYDIDDESRTYLEFLSGEGIVACRESVADSGQLWSGVELASVCGVWSPTLVWNMSDTTIDKADLPGDSYLFQDRTLAPAGTEYPQKDCDVLVQMSMAKRYDDTPYIKWYYAPQLGRIEALYTATWGGIEAEESRVVYILMSGTAQQMRVWYRIYSEMLSDSYELRWIVDSDDAESLPIRNRLDAQAVARDYLLMKEAPRCAILVNPAKSDLLGTIALTLFACRRRIYDVEEVSGIGGRLRLSTLYREMKRSLEKLDLNGYRNRFQHTSYFHPDFDEIFSILKQKKLSLPVVSNMIRNRVKIMVFIAIGRTGSNYFFSLLDQNPLFFNTYELFHTHCVYALENHLDSFSKYTGHSFKNICEEELLDYVHENPESLIEFMKSKCKEGGKKYLTFKVFPEHLEIDKIAKILQRNDVEVFFIKRTPIESYISELKARKSGSWKNEDYTKIRPELHLNNYLKWHHEKSSWYKNNESFLSSINKKFATFYYEEFTKYDDYNNLNFILNAISKIDNDVLKSNVETIKVNQIYKKQDRNKELHDKVDNWDEFYEKILQNNIQHTLISYEN